MHACFMRVIIVCVVLIRRAGDELFDDADWENEADDLIQWSNGLDFEEYQDDWHITATSRYTYIHACMHV